MELLTLSEMANFMNNGFITKVTNTESDQFLFSDWDLDTWYNHKQAKIGDRFYDGNNGDKWAVRAVNHKNHRMVVENLDQRKGMFEMFYW